MKEEKTYYIVNPAGAIHQVNEAHAKWRLGIVGWRLATKEEIQKLLDAKGAQEWDEPICEPFTSEPGEQELPKQLVPEKPKPKPKGE